MCFRLVIISLVTITVAQADIVFSTLTGSTGNGGFDVCGSAPAPGNTPPVPCSQALAERFTSGADFILTDAEVIVGNQTGTSPLFNVWLAQDSGGTPGSFIEQIGFDVSYSGTDVIATGGTGGEVTANSIATPILLHSGTAYWLVLTPSQPDTIVYWDAGSPPYPFACSSCVAITHTTDGTGGWTTYAHTYVGQMQIDGTPFVAEVVPTPEPGFYGTFVVSILGLLIVQRSFRSRCNANNL
jgi:hypothetical protein